LKKERLMTPKSTAVLPPHGKKTAKSPFTSQLVDIEIENLLLDPNNYRFLDRKKFKRKANTRFHEDSVQRATIESLEQSYQLDELKHSILTNGYQSMLSAIPYGCIHRLTWIAQAKHYLSSGASTGDVRELVGSKELLVAKVFSTVDERYKELKLKPYAPTAIALVTTEEIPGTVRRLAENAGIFVFAASDLYYVLSRSLKRNTAGAIRALIEKQSRTIPLLR
jgi:hypothetical protein